jgi:organic radical activating enzyme
MMQNRIRVGSIEYPIVEHCNLSCAHCDHASPLLPAKFASLDQFRRDIESASLVLYADELRVLGGEPLLHPELREFLACAKSSNIAKTVTLVTNGTLLHRVDPRIWEMIDKNCLSVYLGVKYHLSFEELQLLCQKYNVVLFRDDIFSFRQTLINTRIEEPGLVKKIYERCKVSHEWHCYTIYEGRFYKCSPAPFMEGRLKQKKIAFNNRDRDSVGILNNPMLREALQEYLKNRSPLVACSYCLGSSGFKFPHRQLKKKEVIDAIFRDNGPVAELIDDRSLWKAMTRWGAFALSLRKNLVFGPHARNCLRKWLNRG